MAIDATPSGRARIVAGLLRDGDRVLLCHRSPTRRWYPDVWDLPGGHIEDGEAPGAALARELLEELGVTVAEPSGPAAHEVRGATYHMRVWLIDAWGGTVVNAAPEEHDDVAWFGRADLPGLRLAHETYLPWLSRVLDPR